MALESWHWLTQLIESGSFTRASEELHIPQQTLSSRLAALERELGCKLVIRSTPISLTRAGEVFLRYARDQEKARTAMMRLVGEATIGGAGVLKVGISNMRGQVLMPHVIKQFHSSLPGVSVKLIEDTNEELVRLAERNEADLVVARFDDATLGVTIHPLYREEVVCAIRPHLLEEVTGRPADQAKAIIERDGLELLRTCPFLLESVNDISGRIAQVELQHAKIETSGLVRSDNLMTLLALCVAGVGAIFCPTTILDEMDFVTSHLMRIKLSPAACYDIAVGIPQNADPWMPRQVFEDVLGALYGQHQ